MHENVVKTNNSVSADIGGSVCQIFSNCGGEGFNHTFVHDARNQSQSSSSDVLVVADEIVSERIAGEKNLLFEGLVGGRLGLLDYFPVEKHGFSELVAFMLDGDDVGDDVHDNGRVCLIVGHASYQVSHGLGFLLN